MFSIKDKVIVVTGGSGLLGGKIIEVLRGQGAKAISADLKVPDNDELSIKIDITSEQSVRDAVSVIVAKHGRIDGWINNAYPRTSDWGNKFEDIKVESWKQNVDMHLNGYFLCCQVVLEQMKKQSSGSLINMSSIYGLVGPDFNVYNGTSMTMPAAYAAIKGGLNNLTRYLAAYYGPYQVRVNTVSPGGIFDNQPQPFVTNYNNKVPMRRMGNPMDIASATCFLLTDESSYITGHNLVVDGGWTAI
jgi:NAD(P)-dependent dehydrogenase (short-subunit alcohol dehydrogenase family)